MSNDGRSFDYYISTRILISAASRQLLLNNPLQAARNHISPYCNMRNVHLAVLIHGLHGNPGNLAQCEIELVKAHQEKRSQTKQTDGEDLDLEVFIPSTFPGTLTFDGVELLAIRVADELDAKIERISSQGGDVKAISIVSIFGCSKSLKYA